MAQLSSRKLMSGILIYWTLPGSLGPLTPPKNGATGLQSSDFGWNLQSKLHHHHHFIDDPVGLHTTYIRYFDVLNLARKSRTPRWLISSKIRIWHFQPRFIFSKYLTLVVQRPTSDDDVLIKNFIQNQNFGGQWPHFWGGFGSETSWQGSI